jgi:pimeloyl-ACP methyl ester carboxylesterase
MHNQSFSKGFVEVDGLKLAFLVGGEGEPIVFVHGWPTCSYMWRHQVPVLAERFRVYALDLPGFGDSDKPTDVSYTLAFYAGILDGFLKTMDIEQVSLVGHDLGGPIMLLWAVRHLERLARLVIMDTMPYPDLPLMLRLMLPAARLPGVGRAMVSRRGLRFALQLGTVGKEVVTDELVLAYYRPFSENLDARRVLLRILTELEPGEMVEIENNLGRITAPTLILWGEKDPSAPLSIARRLQADIDGSLLKTIPNCGHFLTEDRPEEVNRSLLEFLVPEKPVFGTREVEEA